MDRSISDTVERAAEVAKLIAQCWRDAQKRADLPAAIRPKSLTEGYRAQAQLPAAFNDRVVGYKLAATAQAGQQHIGVDAPVVGRLLASRVADDGATLAMQGNRMLVAECEFVFKLATDLPPRARAYSRDEVMTAVASLHPGLEVPDSRFEDFAAAGAAQLAADNACTHWLAVGPATEANWRAIDLAAHATCLHINGKIVSRGHGKDVLGDPRDALVWLANQFDVTGTAGRPCPIVAGDHITADLGSFGTVSATV